MSRMHSYAHILPGPRPEQPNSPRYRSKMERNWARYLDWLQAQKNDPVVAWRYEWTTLWFPIRRGVTNAKWDFWVWELRGDKCTLTVQEVVGFETHSHRVRRKRTNKYFPFLKVEFIDNRAYHAVARKVDKIIPNWE